MLKILGKNPSGNHKNKVEQSVQYKNGVFTNLSETVMLAKDANFVKLMKDYFSYPKDRVPQLKIPSVLSHVSSINSENPVITWFGHSSYHISIAGQHILVDPVFCGYAAPFSFMVKAFEGSDVFKAEHFKQIDVLILSHDHYDHLDYKTLLELKPRIKKIICSLGVASHLVYWGFAEAMITELDWWQETQLKNGLSIIATPARHFSGRTFKRAQTLWSSFVLKSNGHQLFLGGDSGYDVHFKEIAKRFGQFDLAILECGQYNEKWPLIHMQPEQTVQAGIDLNAKVIMPVHFGKFALAFHSWNEPIKRFVKEAEKLKVNYTCPLIGEQVLIQHTYPTKNWWD